MNNAIPQGGEVPVLRIAFIASCFEPWQDGVGDYTRLLAGELRRLGHRVLLLALNDRWVGADRIEKQDGLETVRFNQASSVESRVARARETLEHFAPDWVSLHYVCYGFHPKGLPWAWNRGIGRLLPIRAKLHIMFHELWVGMEMGASLRHRVFGALQRWLICGMVKRFPPPAVSTSNETYQEVLRQNTGRRASLLPLFSNVPISAPVDEEQIYKLCREQGLTLTRATRQDFTLAGFFGSLHREWPSEPLLTLWQRAEHARGRCPVLLAIGRLGPGKAFWDSLSTRYPGIAFANLGEQPAETISHYLQTLDFGIATSPVALLGKSGTVAAMLDHGLPVVANRDDWKPRAGSSSGKCHALIRPMDSLLERDLIAGFARDSARSRISETADRMLSLFNT